MQWYEDEVARLAQRPVEMADARPKVVFYGSSTFTRWPGLAQSFPQVQTVNLGFGGSTLAACAWFFRQLVPRQQPDALLLYAGDNDLGDGRTPEEVVLFYEHLMASITATLGGIPVCFIGIKLSPARLHLRASVTYANDCIRQRIAATGPPHYYLDVNAAMLDGRDQPPLALFEADGLHLSPQGYAVWQREIGAQLDRLYPPAP
ncbi:GDSL-type esterase/lipase family protein [Hymenobacter terricola]|uniref:GDSL-type esterase/lipase family protein n=1 Tax=Hymenobacter terricola TaxID=2819236 RepID=UPI001B311A29|nr:GDSL-type esterase/lipase family protein [Hymenobacter terricola]